MSIPAPFTRSRALATALVLSLALAACGGDAEETEPDTGTTDAVEDDAGETSTTGEAGTTQDDAGEDNDAGETVEPGGFPVTVDADNGEVTIEARPERIISLSPSTTELLFAIGAGDQVIAVDEFSTFPENAPITDLSGWDPNVEAIVGYEPDLVLMSADANDLVAALGSLGIPVLVSDAPTVVDGVYDEIALLGQATGQVDGAAGAAAGMRAGMDHALAAAPQGQDVRIYHELDDTFFTLSSNSFIGSVYADMGATNIADAADTDGTGYPQLTEEAIIAADPEVIIIPDGTSYTAEDVAARPGWAEVSAVKNGHIVVVDGDIASRWGTRLPQLVQVLAEALSAAAVPAGR